MISARQRRCRKRFISIIWCICQSYCIPILCQQAGRNHDDRFDGTAQLLRFALRQNTASIVNVSSLEVYGSIYDDSHPLSEEEQGYIHLSDTRSSYPVAKRAAECLCHAYAREYGVHVKTARLAQTFGAGVTADDTAFSHSLPATSLPEKTSFSIPPVN